ncbi:MAG: hypothetical protein QQM50_02145 [Dehalococcoides mccartyi]|jgi:predicted membrane chloride channel (bestrophin family)|uniref:Uncharacterized protein n=1 Tax=Dehalococcoides mccartyi TaxID=61435 RepID=A0AB38Z9Y2_9CHLR|nr:hypothetical protein [Dehalococcoides mccartyi]MDP4279336.1 hypothetical protein [Dehalococcoides mccartyi]WRO06657.1 hypothetical protein VLL09_04510 [Dehalococcoides mccartyi]WRO07397.1 hypothetical protein VLL09_00415 [Dehalococcoides mccartyi]
MVTETKGIYEYSLATDAMTLGQLGKELDLCSQELGGCEHCSQEAICLALWLHLAETVKDDCALTARQYTKYSLRFRSIKARRQILMAFFSA